MKYERTKNPNIIKKIETIESEIHLDILAEQVKKLEDEIKSIPEPKEKPDDETLEFFNMHNMGFNKEELTRDLKEKKDLLERLKGL